MAIALSFLGANLGKINLFHQLVETGSIAWGNSSVDRFKQLKENLEIFSVASVCIGILSALTLVEGKLSLLSRSTRIVPGLTLPAIPFFVGAAIGMGLLAAGTIIAMSMNRISRPTEDLNSYLPNKHNAAKAEWGAPSFVEFPQSLMITRLIINVALACLSVNPYLFLASAALEVIGAGLMSRWKWIVYTCTFKPKAERNENLSLFTKGPQEITFSCFFQITPSCTHQQQSNEKLVKAFHNQFKYLDTLFLGFFICRGKDLEYQKEGIEKPPTQSTKKHEIYANGSNLLHLTSCENKRPCLVSPEIELKIVDSRSPGNNESVVPQIISTEEFQSLSRSLN
ncbi:MAG TPA: hypothetical protein VGM34_01570 [Chlamydiales bacterium]|jgi:hypothetical protein